MLRSMYSGISGMKANQTKLDVIGNNIANVSTTAFKSSTARFQDMLSQSVKDSMAPNSNQGGVNSAQVGLGVKLASIDSVMKQGNLQSTGRSLDLAIDGDGFFMVSKGSSVFGDNQLEVNQRAGAHNITSQSLANSGAQLMYTRDGALSLDEQGNLITADGYRVMGYALSNDPTTQAPTSVSPSNVQIDGFDVKFGPGSALNGYKVALGTVGPQTVTSANIDKTNKEIIINGDFSTPGALTSAQVESAVNKALNSAGIAQSVYVAGKPDVIPSLTTDKTAGGLDDAAPDSVSAAGLTFQFGNGSELNGYSIQFDKINQTPPTVSVQTTVPKRIVINADLVGGNVNNDQLLSAINDQLKLNNINQTLTKITGSASTLSQITATTDNAGSVAAAPSLTDPTTGSLLATQAIGGLNFGFTNGGSLNGYTIKFGSTTASPAITIDKSNMIITLSGDYTNATNVANLATNFNNQLIMNGITTPSLNTVTGTYDSTANQSAKVASGSDDVKPADVTVANLKFSFPVGTTYNGYTVKIGEVGTGVALSAACDPTAKTITLSGDFLDPNQFSSTDIQNAIKTAVLANPPVAGMTSAQYDSTYKISVGTGTAKTYTSLVSDQVAGGTSMVAPTLTGNTLGLNFAAGPGAALNGYSIQIGTITAGTKPSVDVDATNKKIIINGDFVTPGVTVDTINREISKALTSAQINQSLTVLPTSSLKAVSASQALSETTSGGTPVESLDQSGDISFVDGTKTLFSYDGALKTLRIPEKVKIPGTDQELRIKSYTIDKSGVINGVLEDGRVAALGQIAMASFNNAAGLTKMGGNLYSQSVNSGDATIKSGVNTKDDDNSSGFGDNVQGMLEMSNVDLAEQFTEMITATRAFQASGKMISTGDDILQDIINLKR